LEFPTGYLLRGSKFSLEKGIAENEYASLKLSVVSNIKKSYFTVLALLEQVKIAFENLSIAQDFIKKAEIRYSLGEGSNLENLTAKVNFAEARNNVEIQKSRLAAAFAELNFAMGNGKEESKTFLLTDTLAFIPFEVTLSRLADDALAVNPALKASKLRIDSYSKEKSLAWSSLLPNLNIGYFNKQVRDEAKGYYGASLSIGGPLWFMLDQRGRILEASSNVSSAEAEFKKVNNDVYAKTQAAFAEFKHEEKQVQFYVQDILPQAKEIFRTASKSYEAGEITYMEFLQAQQTLINSKGSYADALLSYNLSIVTIEEAIGKTLQ
jgi:outer membrane protein TolC